MLFLLPGILLISAVVLAVWALFFRVAWRNERAIQAARARAAEIEKRISTPGEPLFCLACCQPVVAPLPCPQCDSRAFLAPADMCSDFLTQAVPVVTASPASTANPTPARSSRRRIVSVGKNEHEI